MPTLLCVCWHKHACLGHITICWWLPDCLIWCILNRLHVKDHDTQQQQQHHSHIQCKILNEALQNQFHFYLFLFSFTRVWISFNVMLSLTPWSQHGKVIIGCHKNDNYISTFHLRSTDHQSLVRVARHAELKTKGDRTQFELLHLKTNRANSSSTQKHSVYVVWIWSLYIVPCFTFRLMCQHFEFLLLCLTKKALGHMTAVLKCVL